MTGPYAPRNDFGNVDHTSSEKEEAMRSFFHCVILGPIVAGALLAGGASGYQTNSSGQAPVKPPLTVWVAPGGDDANAGTKDAPLATIAQAQRKTCDHRRMGGRGEVTIILKDGVYFLSEPLRFGPKDSGDAPTWIKSAVDEKATISGGIKIENWEQVTETVAGLCKAARGKIWEAPAPFVNGRPLEFRQFWVGGQKATRARTPNAGDMIRLTLWDRDKREAGFPAGTVESIDDPAGMEMFLQQQWETAILRIKTLKREDGRAIVTFCDPESRIEFEHPWPQPLMPPEGPGGAFILTNRIEFLDSPGEWVLSHRDGKIYYWPREGEDMEKIQAIAPALTTLLEVAGTADRPVEHIHFSEIRFEHAGWSEPSFTGHVPLQLGMKIIDAYKLRPKGTPEWRSLDNQAWVERMPAGVSVTGAEDVWFWRCQFRHMGASGLDLGAATRNCSAVTCHFEDIGGSGLQAGSFQEAPIETHLPYDPQDERELCDGVKIEANTFEDTANEDWGCAAIAAGYVRDIAIEQNYIKNTSYTGISLGWGWTRTINCMRNNLIHANRIERCATRLCDTAGIYTLSAQPGTVISNNVIEKIEMSPWVDRPGQWSYLYADEGSSYMTFKDNWCAEDKTYENAVGAGLTWENNGPDVEESITESAGPYDLRNTIR